jgi:hypothetical protein
MTVYISVGVGSGGRSVGIVRSQTVATELVSWLFDFGGSDSVSELQACLQRAAGVRTLSPFRLIVHR